MYFRKVNSKLNNLKIYRNWKFLLWLIIIRIQRFFSRNLIHLIILKLANLPCCNNSLGREKGKNMNEINIDLQKWFSLTI